MSMPEIPIPPMLGLNEILPEDMEEGGLRADYVDGIVDDRHLINFIEKYTHSTVGHEDYYNNILRDIFSQPQTVSNILWVENPINGNFIPVRKDKSKGTAITKKSSANEDGRGLENVPLIPHLFPDEINNEQDQSLTLPPPPAYSIMNDRWTMISMEFRNFIFFKRLLYLLIQGVLAGFCLVTIFLQLASVNNNASLLTNYQPIAQDTRRIFYLFSTISLVGSIDYIYDLLDLYSPKNPFYEDITTDIATKLEEYQKKTFVLGIATIVLYTLAYMVSLYISFMDVEIYLRDNYNPSTDGSSWTAFALNDAAFVKSFDNWKNANIVRAAACLLAWCCCCVLLWRDISRYNKLWLSLHRVRQTAVAWMKRTKALEGGEEIEKLPVNELRKIINVQEMGLQRAKTILNYLEQDGGLALHHD